MARWCDALRFSVKPTAPQNIFYSVNRNCTHVVSRPRLVSLGGFESDMSLCHDILVMLIDLPLNDDCLAAIFALIAGCVLTQLPGAMWSFSILVPSATLLPCDDVPGRCRFMARSDDSPSMPGQAEPPNIHAPDFVDLDVTPSIPGQAEPSDIHVPDCLDLCWLDEFDE